MAEPLLDLGDIGLMQKRVVAAVARSKWTQRKPNRRESPDLFMVFSRVAPFPAVCLYRQSLTIEARPPKPKARCTAAYRRRA
jgi:hypothetical protein